MHNRLTKRMMHVCTFSLIVPFFSNLSRRRGGTGGHAHTPVSEAESKSPSETFFVKPSDAKMEQLEKHFPPPAFLALSSHRMSNDDPMKKGEVFRDQGSAPPFPLRVAV